MSLFTSVNPCFVANLLKKKKSLGCSREIIQVGPASVIELVNRGSDGGRFISSVTLCVVRSKGRDGSAGSGWWLFGTNGAGGSRRSGLVKPQIVSFFFFFCRGWWRWMVKRPQSRSRRRHLQKVGKMGHSHLLPPLARDRVERRVRHGG